MMEIAFYIFTGFTNDTQKSKEKYRYTYMFVINNELPVQNILGESYLMERQYWCWRIHLTENVGQWRIACVSDNEDWYCPSDGNSETVTVCYVLSFPPDYGKQSMGIGFVCCLQVQILTVIIVIFGDKRDKLSKTNILKVKSWFASKKKPEQQIRTIDAKNGWQKTCCRYFWMERKCRKFANLC